MDEQERRALAQALEGLSEEKLDQVHGAAKKTLHDLEDLNSAFPATQEFLRARGLSNVRELDSQGMAELKAHLQRLYDELYKNKA